MAGLGTPDRRAIDLSAGSSLDVVPDAANLIADLSVEGGLLEGLLRAGAPPIGRLLYGAFGCLSALCPCRVHRQDPVRSVGVPSIEVFDPKSALAAGEHLERFRLVLLHRNDGFLEQGFGFPGVANSLSATEAAVKKNLSRGESGG